MSYRYALLALLFPLAALAQPSPCVDGFAGVYACHNVDLLAQPTDVGATDIWGWTDPETGTEYAIIFLGGEATFFDLSDPTNPIHVASVAATGGKDGRTYGDYLFIVDDFGLPGMLVVDLSQLRDIEDPPALLEPDAVYTGISSAHNLSLDPESGFAYPVLVGVGSSECTGSLHIVDVRDPLTPTYAGCLDSPRLGAFHDAHCVTYDGPDTDFIGREVCFGSVGSDGLLSIVDVTDKENPRRVAEAIYPNAAYTHQGWLTEDSRYFILNDEFDEGTFDINTRTIVFDVANLNDPNFAFEYYAETTSTDHNLFVKGNYVYQANYGAGFRMLDLSGIDDGVLSEAAFFETRGEDGRGSLWGVYPFFESGIVIVSDMSRGLFVLRPTLDTSTDVSAGPTGTFALSAHPNPFANRATISLTLAAAQHVTVAVYDVLGREVAVLHDGLLPADEEHALGFDAAALPAGMYIVRAAGTSFEATRSVTLVR